VLITNDNYMASINEKEERRGWKGGGWRGEEMASAGSIDGGTLIRALKVIKKRIRKIQRSGWSGLQDLEEATSSVQS
jgi:hypothetical protein